MRKPLYLILAIAGTIWPISHLFSWSVDNGLNLTAFIGAAFDTNISGIAWADLLVSSAVFWVFLFHEGVKRKMGNLWIYVVLNLFIGLSLALPLFLFFREDKLDH